MRYLLWPLAQRLGLVVNTSFSEAALPLLVQALEQQREAVRGEETAGSGEEPRAV